MMYKLTTYRTVTGTKEVLEIPKKKETEWIIYQDNAPKFHVDCFDLQSESNVIMNSLVLCQQRSIEEVLRRISKKNKVNLAVVKPPMIEIEVKSEFRELQLPPLPEAWLN